MSTETKFVSLDTSTTCSGLALYVNGNLNAWAKLTPLKKITIEERMYTMADMIQDKLDEWKPDIVYIETPQGHGANVKLARNLGMMLGVVMGWCASHGVDFNEVAPSQWRKWAGWSQGKLTRSELKQMSIDEVKKRHNIDVGDDVADAINLGYGVLQHFNDETLFD